MEIVKEWPLQDKKKKHQDLVDEVFNTNQDHVMKQIEMLSQKFNRRDLDLDEASQILRDDFLDRYFKDTYVEWGMRTFMEKAHLNN